MSDTNAASSINKDKQVIPVNTKKSKPPWGAGWRSSTWYITTVVGYGSMTEAFCYMVGVPIIPFHLEDLGFDQISTKSSWFLFAYCISVSLFSLPSAIFLDRKSWRRGPLLAATCLMQVGLLLLTFVDKYPVMIVARTLQGLSCTVIWSVGFALICENVEKNRLGRQLGFAFTGMQLGNVVGPVAGSGLYTAYGWKGPWVLCMGVCSVELLGRWLVVEQKSLIGFQRSSSLEEKRTSSNDPMGNIENGLTENQSTTPTETPPAEVRKHLSPFRVIITLFSIPRGLTAIGVNFASGLIIGAIDPTLTLHLKDAYGKEPEFVGLVYLATFAPAFLAGPLTGWLADKFGPEWILPPTVLLCAPFCLLMMLEESLPGFIICFGFLNLFQGCLEAPIGVEVAAVAKANEGISELHQFAAINVAWAAPTAIGTVIGGLLYAHVSWNAVCWFCFACCFSILPATLAFTGDRPLLHRIIYRKSSTRNTAE